MYGQQNTAVTVYTVSLSSSTVARYSVYNKQQLKLNRAEGSTE